MTGSVGDHPDASILAEMRELVDQLSDERGKGLLESAIGAVALNPQPLPPEPPDEAMRFRAIVTLVRDAVALNPQPLPPEPPVDEEA